MRSLILAANVFAYRSFLAVPLQPNDTQPANATVPAALAPFEAPHPSQDAAVSLAAAPANEIQVPAALAPFEAPHPSQVEASNTTAETAFVNATEPAVVDETAVVNATEPAVVDETAVVNATEPTEANASLVNATAAAPEPEPAAEAAPVFSAPAPPQPSAADVYLRVNSLLNRMNSQARMRVHDAEAADEEAAAVAARQSQQKEVVVAEQKAAAAAEAEVEAAEQAVEVDEAADVNATVATPASSANATAQDPECDCEGKPDCGCSGNRVEPASVKADPAPLSEQEERERAFPTDWIKHDVKFNVDKDQMKDREDAVDAAVRAQQGWNTQTRGMAWLEEKSFRLRPWGQ